jgi:hypothetical protein
MRLYRQHDLDLIYLYKVKDFSFQKHMKAALHAFLNDEPYMIEVPQNKEGIILPKSIQFHLCLSEDKDADIIAWIKLLSNGYRNSLLKNMFRNYLSAPVVIPYLKNSEISTENKISTFIKRVKKESVKTEKELVDEVLSATLPDNNPNFKSNIIKEVLDTNISTNREQVLSASQNDKSQPDTNSNGIGKTSLSDTEDAASDESFDFFGEFDSMLNNF